MSSLCPCALNPDIPLDSLNRAEDGFDWPRDLKGFGRIPQACDSLPSLSGRGQFKGPESARLGDESGLSQQLLVQGCECLHRRTSVQLALQCRSEQAHQIERQHHPVQRCFGGSEVLTS